MIDLFGHIYEESECNCEKCNSMCSNNKPCWGLPEEIEAIMNSGYIHRLMLVYYLDNDYRPIQILSPALIGYESKVAPVIQIGRCTFFNAKNACTLHNLNLKPLEGRIANCKSDRSHDLRNDIAILWKTPKAKELIIKWKESICQSPACMQSIDK